MPLDLNRLWATAAGIAVTLTLRWVLRRSRSRAEVSADGRRVLRYVGYEAIGWIGSAGSSFLLVMSLLTVEREKAIPLSAFLAAFTVLSLLLVWMGRRCTITYTDTDVHYVPLFTPAFSFAWESIVSAKYSVLAQWWVFCLADGRKVRVHTHMNRRRDFIEAGRRHVSVPIPDARPAHLNLNAG